MVNVWANRLIGDEQEPADIVWGSERYNDQKRYGGRPLDAYPEWVINGTPRPSAERRTFTTWNPVKKDQPLLPSGLLGPVEISSNESRGLSNRFSPPPIGFQFIMKILFYAVDQAQVVLQPSCFAIRNGVVDFQKKAECHHDMGKCKE